MVFFFGTNQVDHKLSPEEMAKKYGSDVEKVTKCIEKPRMKCHAISAITLPLKCRWVFCRV